VIDLGIIDAQGNILYDSLLKPSCAIEEGAIAVHQITESMVSAAPCFSEEWPEILKRIGKCSIITYKTLLANERNRRVVH
jgi:DNA polymerase III epsilon subunit-like protein